MNKFLMLFSIGRSAKLLASVTVGTLIGTSTIFFGQRRENNVRHGLEKSDKIAPSPSQDPSHP